jgi:hypothetical protein
VVKPGWLKVRVVLAMGPGNPPAVQIRTANMVWLGSKAVQKPDPLHLGGPNSDPNPSKGELCRVWLDPSGPISGSGLRAFQFMVAFRYPIANRKILSLEYHCSFLMYWPPLKSKTSEKHSLPDPANENQR